MAYGVMIGSVATSEVEAYSSGSAAAMRPSLLVSCSHLAAYWLREDPLGDLLGEAIDEGERLGSLWHPLREPIYVEPAEVCRRAQGLTQAWEHTAISDEWGAGEAKK
jgi:hypothetical protein